MKKIGFFAFFAILLYSQLAYAWDFPTNALTVSLKTMGNVSSTVMTVPLGETYTILSVRSSKEKAPGIVHLTCEGTSKSVFYSSGLIQANQVYTQQACGTGAITYTTTGIGGGDEHVIYIIYVTSELTTPQLIVSSSDPANTAQSTTSQYFFIFAVFSVCFLFTYNLIRRLL